MLYCIWVNDDRGWSVFATAEIWDEFLEDYNPELLVEAYLNKPTTTAKTEPGFDKTSSKKPDRESPADSHNKDDEDISKLSKKSTKSNRYSSSSTVASSWKVSSLDIPKLTKNKESVQ